MEVIEAKTILQRAIHGEEWFGIDYNMNLYKGCCHKCIYCDSIRNVIRLSYENGAKFVFSMGGKRGRI